MGKDKNYYLQCFSSLTLNHYHDEWAPHKPILLLSLIDLYEYGVLDSIRIELSPMLEYSFSVTWSRYAKPSEHYHPTIANPFWHLHNEPFWRLVPKKGSDVKSFSSPYSIDNLKNNFYAEIDQELFLLLENEPFRNESRNLLITTYLK